MTVGNFPRRAPHVIAGLALAVLTIVSGVGACCAPQIVGFSGSRTLNRQQAQPCTPKTQVHCAWRRLLMILMMRLVRKTRHLHPRRRISRCDLFGLTTIRLSPLPLTVLQLSESPPAAAKKNPQDACRPPTAVRRCGAYQSDSMNRSLNYRRLELLLSTPACGIASLSSQLLNTKLLHSKPQHLSHYARLSAKTPNRPKMAAPALTIGSTFKLPSGYEIPRLGFGVGSGAGSRQGRGAN